MAPFVQTVLGRVDPDRARLHPSPRAHRSASSGTIPERWDYWELTADDELHPAELGRFRDAGGTCLVDLTLPGIGRDPAWLRRLARRTGLHVVMGCGWYRQPYYPPDALIDRRTVGELADELVREFEEGVPGSEDEAGCASGPGSSARSGPTSRG